jgi:putative oxidoreductase
MKKVIGWILVVLLAILFALVGGLKLLGVPGAVKEFDMIGFGQWFRYVTGVLEVTGAVGLLIPRYRLWAALLIAVIMVGATAINIWVLHVPGLARVTAVLMAMALVLAGLIYGQLRTAQQEKT